MKGHVLFSGPEPQKNVGGKRAGVVALGDGGHVLVLGPAPQKNLGGTKEGRPDLMFLVMQVMCCFSGPAPQKNVGGMREGRAGVVALGDGGHVLVLRSCATKECGWARVAALGFGGHVLVLRSCATKEYSRNDGGNLGNINDLI
ncbi:hypothetical protein TNCV_1808591 [Trichonephila clavipes]|nr:hypothetical protein TNCV_1808591 [Trichonephila clavipes]